MCFLFGDVLVKMHTIVLQTGLWLVAKKLLNTRITKETYPCAECALCTRHDAHTLCNERGRPGSD
jgi:hypothetical protein